MILLAKRLLLTLLIVPLLVIVLLYLIIQTRPAALLISGWLSEKSDYSINIGQISHSLFNPLKLKLKNIKIASISNHELLNAEKAVLEFIPQPLTSTFHFTSISLENGYLELNAIKESSHPFTSDSLMLKNINILVNHEQFQLNALQVNGGIQPWLANKPLLDYDNQFRLTANSLKTNGPNADSFLLSQPFILGDITQGTLNLTTFGADIAQGQLTGKGTLTNKGDLYIQQMDLNNLKWQFNDSAKELLEHIMQLPKIDINRLALLNSTFEGKDWAANDVSLSLKNLSLYQGVLKEKENEKGGISISANQFIYGKWLFDEPIIKLSMSSDDLVINQIHSRWGGGLIRTNGVWSRSKQHLTLDELIIAGAEYVLPEGGYKTYQQLIPGWLSNLSIKRLNSSRNILVDTTATFPFQITLLDGDAHNMRLIKNSRLGIWSGNLTFTALNATFNKVDLQYPQLSMIANEDYININELGAIIGKGLIEANVTIAQPPSETLKLELTGHNIMPSILSQWGWYDISIQSASTVNLTLSNNEKGTLLSGQLKVNSKQGEQLIQSWPKSPEDENREKGEGEIGMLKN